MRTLRNCGAISDKVIVLVLFSRRFLGRSWRRAPQEARGRARNLCTELLHLFLAFLLGAVYSCGVDIELCFTAVHACSPVFVCLCRASLVMIIGSLASSLLLLFHEGRDWCGKERGDEVTKQLALFTRCSLLAAFK